MLTQWTSTRQAELVTTQLLLLFPFFALFGFTSIKMSGASLGHTGGTADKIKVFEGLENNLSQEKAFEIAKKQVLAL